MTMEGVINNNINLIPKFDEIFPIVKICWSGNHICEEIVSFNILWKKAHKLNNDTKNISKRSMSKVLGMFLN